MIQSMKCDCDKVRIGLVGLGRMGKEHLRAFLKMPDVAISCVVTTKSTDEARASGVPSTSVVTDSIEQMLSRRDVDVVDVCSPSHTHYSISRLALTEDRDVICEKPIAVDLWEGHELVEISKQRGKLLLIGHVLRFDPIFVLSRALVKAGFVGRVIRARTFRGIPYPRWGEWYREEKKSGGSIVDLLIHDFDFVAWTLGLATAVRAERLSEDASLVSVHLFFANSDIAACVQGGWSDDPRFAPRIQLRVSGEFASIEFDRTRVHAGPPLLDIVGGDTHAVPAALLIKQEFDPLFYELRHFVDCVQGKCKPRIDPQEALYALAVALSARESLLKRQTVGLPHRNHAEM